jgi:hypothetical protein
MISADRVLQLDQWQLTTDAVEKSQAQWLRLAFLGFPGTLAFRLRPDEALDLAEAIATVVKHYASEGTAGPLTVFATDHYTSPPRARVLQLQFVGPFPGECSLLLTESVARRLAAQLIAAAQPLNTPQAQ